MNKLVDRKILPIRKEDFPLIAPSLLAADIGRLGDEIEDIVQSGADWLHLDVMDGSFVPPITFGANIVSLARKLCELPIDAHLMVNNPQDHIQSFAKAGCNLLTIHQEVTPHLHRALGTIKSFGMCAGVAINPGTPVHSLFDVLSECDLVLVMSVNPGWGGQAFIPHSLKKIATLRKYIDDNRLSTIIEVDGGVDDKTAAECLDAGADVLVAGTAIFHAKDRRASIAALKRANNGKKR